MGKGMLQLPIYMDNHSTTRTDPRVVEAMLPYFTVHFGNAASRTHAFGWKAAEAVEEARTQVASVIGADSKSVIFTSGATESNNLAIKGACRLNQHEFDHVITVQTEHRAVLDPCRRLESEGFRVTFLPVDRFGRIAPRQVADAITSRTALVSVMLANNEVGTLQPVAEVGALCKERQVLLHTDATQAVGRIEVDVEELQADLLSLSAHKIYGPKGVGALYVRRRNPHVRLEPMLEGGGHERGMRSGTLPVPSIVGFGAAAALCASDLMPEARRLRTLRERLFDGLSAALSDIVLNGHPEERLPNNVNVSFANVRGEALLMALRNVAVSSGSACTSASVEPSYVLRALGVADELAHSSIRFGLGRFNTIEEVDYVIEEVTRVVRHLRSLNPEGQLATAGI
jgi:cysteine desulfurase